MGIFDGYLICSDFDGTMAYEAKISKENCAAIAYFQSEGGIFCPCSGRQPSFFHDYSEFFRPNGPVITLNGSVIVRYTDDPENDEVLYCGGMSSELTEELVRDARDLPGMKHTWVCCDNTCYVILPTGKQPEGDPGERKLIEPEEIKGFIQKVVFVHDGLHLDEIRAALEPKYRDRLAFGSSWGSGLEAQLIGTTKGDSVLRVKEMVGAHTLVCVGDYENDLTMLKAADISYAVGNAIDCLKAVADRVTVPVNEHAIVAIVKDLERDSAERRKN